jgi:thiol-disulfide isomerase/thioredoxin
VKALIGWMAVALAAAGWAGTEAATLDLADQPKDLPAFAVTDDNGNRVAGDAFKGKVMVLDYWATWCAPCRSEFPALDRLQDRLGPKGLLVVPVSLDRDGRQRVDAFYDELHVTHLAKYLDPKWASAQVLGVQGLPTVLVVDRQGREVARAEGPVDWDGSQVAEILERLLEP